MHLKIISLWFPESWSQHLRNTSVFSSPFTWSELFSLFLMVQDSWLVWDSLICHYNYFLFWSVMENKTLLSFFLVQRYSIPFSSKLNFSSCKNKGKLTSPTFYHIMHYWEKLESYMLKSPLGQVATQGTGLTKFCCSVAKLYLTLHDHMDDSTPGLPVLHCLPEFAQIHVHWVGAAIEPSHPRSSPSPALFLRGWMSGHFPDNLPISTSHFFSLK